MVNIIINYVIISIIIQNKNNESISDNPGLLRSSRFVYALNEKWMLFPQHSEGHDIRMPLPLLFIFRFVVKSNFSHSNK